MNPLNLIYLNQPIMASPDLFQYWLSPSPWVGNWSIYGLSTSGLNDWRGKGRAIFLFFFSFSIIWCWILG
jgi:hypothetical protein